MKNPSGRFDVHGRLCVPETPMNTATEPKAACHESRADPALRAALSDDNAGRSRRLCFARRMPAGPEDARIDLDRTCARRINIVPGYAHGQDPADRRAWE